VTTLVFVAVHMHLDFCTVHFPRSLLVLRLPARLPRFQIFTGDLPSRLPLAEAMPSGRILVDATVRHLNAIAAPKHLLFRKARWEQAPDACELDGLCIFPEEKPWQKEAAGRVATSKLKVPPTAISKGVGLPLENNIENPVAKDEEVDTRAQAIETQISAHGLEITPKIDVDFFIFAAVAFGLGAWNQPVL
jgi:hypothetical protein